VYFRTKLICSCTVSKLRHIPWFSTGRYGTYICLIQSPHHRIFSSLHDSPTNTKMKYVQRLQQGQATHFSTKTTSGKFSHSSPWDFWYNSSCEGLILFFLGLRRQSSLSWPFQGVSGCWTYCWTDGVMELPLLTNVENNVKPKVFITLANYLCYNLGTTYFHKHAHYHNYAHLDIKPGPSAKADCETTSNNNTSRPITWSYL